MKKLLYLIIVLFCANTVNAQNRDTIAIMLNSNGTKSYFFHYEFQYGIRDENGNYIMPRVDSMKSAGKDFVWPNSTDEFWPNAKGIYVNFGKAEWSELTGTPAAVTNLSGTNTGDNATNSQYAGLAASKQDVLGFTALPNTTTAGVGASPTASSTTTVTHNLGRVPSIIRIYGYGTFTANAAATSTTSSIGVFNSSGNFCVYQRYGAAITTTQAGLSSNTFSILLATGGGNFISGVIQNVDADSFDIVWTETGTATAQVYLWEAQ